ncbi:MAG: hypothetical protein AAGA45_03735 [Verrucomicrobiota bacterium]
MSGRPIAYSRPVGKSRLRLASTLMGMSKLRMLLFKGFVLGFIFSVTMVSGTVWCVQVTKRYGWSAGLAAALGITTAQAIWIMLAVIMLTLISYVPLQEVFSVTARVLAGAVFLYLSFKLYRAPKAESLSCSAKNGATAPVFRGTLAVSLGMPMRLFGYIAFGIAAGIIYHPLDLGTAGVVVVSAVAGTAAWWLYMVVLTVIFAPKVQDRVALHSINKLNPLGGTIYLVIALMTFAPLLITRS